MKKRGSQIRENYKEAKYKLMSYSKNDKNVILEDEDGQRELWTANDNFAGYVVEINGVGYEFVRSGK